MDFAFNEIQTEIRELARGIFADFASPDKRHVIEQQTLRFDPKLWSAVSEAGLANVSLPESAGGIGLGFFEACLVFEQAGAFTVPVPVIPHALALIAMAEAGSDAINMGVNSQDSWMAASSGIAGNSLEIDEQGKVTGHLSGVPYASGASALVAPSADGTALLLIKLEQPSVVLHEQVSTACEPQSHCVFTRADATALGDADAVQRFALRELVAMSAAQLGVTAAAMELARSHVCEREQFGVKIGSFQAVSHRLADCWIDLMNLTTTVLSAASRLDVDASIETQLEVYTAQSWASQASHRILASAQHVCGGLGHDKDYPMWRFAVWSRHYEMMMGGNELALEHLGALIAAQPERAML